MHMSTRALPCRIAGRTTVSARIPHQRLSPIAGVQPQLDIFEVLFGCTQSNNALHAVMTTTTTTCIPQILCKAREHKFKPRRKRQRQSCKCGPIKRVGHFGGLCQCTYYTQQTSWTTLDRRGLATESKLSSVTRVLASWQVGLACSNEIACCCSLRVNHCCTNSMDVVLPRLVALQSTECTVKPEHVGKLSVIEGSWVIFSICPKVKMTLGYQGKICRSIRVLYVNPGCRLY